jgi:hypothetical protein
VGLKLIFVIVPRVVPVLGLSRWEAWWKDAEILMLRHQLSVALRERPRAHSRLTWPGPGMAGTAGRTLPVDRLAAMRLIVTPGTILRWHRDILRRRWARRSRHSGRPPVRRNIRSVVLRLARENESWGTAAFMASWPGFGITVAPSTVWQVLKSAGSTRRRDGPGWPEFLRSQAQGILAPDFFTADLLNGAKIYVLAAIEHGTRRVRVLGATGHPVQAWVVQQARNLLMDLEDAGTPVKVVLHDRDASFTLALDAVFRAAGVRVIRSAVQAQRMNSIMERWIGRCRRELLDRTLIWNQRHLIIVLREYGAFLLPAARDNRSRDSRDRMGVRPARITSNLLSPRGIADAHASDRCFRRCCGCLIHGQRPSSTTEKKGTDHESIDSRSTCDRSLESHPRSRRRSIAVTERQGVRLALAVPEATQATLRPTQGTSHAPIPARFACQSN